MIRSIIIGKGKTIRNTYTKVFLFSGYTTQCEMSSWDSPVKVNQFYLLFYNIIGNRTVLSSTYRGLLTYFSAMNKAKKSMQPV